MTADAQSMPTPTGKPPKRRFRNFLLDARFQLKYTGMVVLVTIVVTGLVGWWLGSKAYEQSRETSQMLVLQGGGGGEEFGELDAEFHQLLVEETRAQDLRVRNRIITGIVLLVVVLAVALGFTGIIVTHRVVGPAYKLKLLLGDVARGQLNVKGGLRKGDELQDVGDAFKGMVVALRERREEELADLEAAIEKARAAEVDEDVLASLIDLRDRLQATLDA